VFRNVKNYGARGDGKQDDWQYIMKAITEGGRCGERCNATTTKGAIIYFPPGRYKISRPIVQYYYTMFVGNYGQRATIVGSNKFEGIALIDTNVYYEKSKNPKGENW
jgi:pectate lyase-like protein